MGAHFTALEETAQPMNDTTRRVPAELTERAKRRSMAIRWSDEPPTGWELYNPFRVVCFGTLGNVADWLTAAESTHR